MQTSIKSTQSLWPSRALLSFVQRQVSQHQPHAGMEYRSEPRLLLAMPVIVQGVDEQIAPVGEPQAMVVRDHSTRGLGLVYEQPFEHARIVVRLSYPEEGKVLAAEVRWSKPLGPFYQLGCEIVAHLNRFPALE
jgi:PilZ domain